MTAIMENLEVKKLTLSQLPTLAGIVRNLPKTLGSMDDLTNQTLLEKLPEIIENGLPELAKITALVTNIKENKVVELPLDEFTEIVAKVLEVNNFEKVIKNLKAIKSSVNQKN